MRWSIRVNRLLLVFTLLSLPFIVGSGCFFAFSSGGGSGGVIVKDDDDDEDDDDELQTTGVAQTGTLSSAVANSVAPGGPAAAGVSFTSASLSGVTDSHGHFRYIDGETVQFFIGDIALGAPVAGKPAIAPTDLAAQDSGGATAATNISRLLHSLDATPGDDVVTIPAGVRAAAVRSNASVSAAIEYLDFAEEVAFANAASQLVAVLTHDYPHTAALVEADRVEADPVESTPPQPPSPKPTR